MTELSQEHPYGFSPTRIQSSTNFIQYLYYIITQDNRKWNDLNQHFKNRDFHQKKVTKTCPTNQIYWNQNLYRPFSKFERKRSTLILTLYMIEKIFCRKVFGNSKRDRFPKLSDLYLCEWCLLRFYIQICRSNKFHSPIKKNQSEGQLKTLVW